MHSAISPCFISDCDLHYVIIPFQYSYACNHLLNSKFFRLSHSCFYPKRDKLNKNGLGSTLQTLKIIGTRKNHAYILMYLLLFACSLSCIVFFFLLPFPFLLVYLATTNKQTYNIHSTR